MFKFISRSFFLTLFAIGGALVACTSSDDDPSTNPDASTEPDARTGDAGPDGSTPPSSDIFGLERELGRLVEFKLTHSPLLATTSWTIHKEAAKVLGLPSTGSSVCENICFDRENESLDCQFTQAVNACGRASLFCYATPSFSRNAVMLNYRFGAGVTGLATLAAFDVQETWMRGHLRHDWTEHGPDVCKGGTPRSLALDVDVTFTRTVADAGTDGGEADGGPLSDAGETSDGGQAASFCINGGTVTLASETTRRTYRWTGCGTGGFVD